MPVAPRPQQARARRQERFFVNAGGAGDLPAVHNHGAANVQLDAGLVAFDGHATVELLAVAQHYSVAPERPQAAQGERDEGRGHGSRGRLSRHGCCFFLRRKASRPHTRAKSMPEVSPPATTTIGSPVVGSQSQVGGRQVMSLKISSI